jgi:hypothetical protein
MSSGRADVHVFRCREITGRDEHQIRAIGPWPETVAPSADGAQERWSRLVEAHDISHLLDAGCSEQSLVLARLSQLLHHRPELRCVSLASQLDEGNLWAV